MAYTVDTRVAGGAASAGPRLPRTPRQSAWATRALMLLAPLISFTMVEYLNYNNPWTDFSPPQITLNLAWYYLARAVFLLRPPAAGLGRPAGPWGSTWGLGLANHYLISFRGRTLFPGDFLSLGTAPMWRGNTTTARPSAVGDHRRDSRRCCWRCPSCPGNAKKRPFPWRLFLPAAGAAAVFLGVFFGTGLVEGPGHRALHVDHPGQRPGPQLYGVHEVHEVGEAGDL